MSEERPEEITSQLAREGGLETPAFVFDEQRLLDNAREVRDLVGPDVRLLLAMKAFTVEEGLRAVAPLLDGLHASSLFEARLARAVLGEDGLIHVTTPALRDDEVGEICRLADHVSANSLPQWRRFRYTASPRCGWGLRVNPGLSMARDPRYDPCGPIPRLGVPVAELAELAANAPEELAGLAGLLVHANCEATDVTPVLRTVELLEDRLPRLLDNLTWIDLGGGYLFQDVADPEPFEQAVRHLRARDLTVLVEPGTALVAAAGYLVASVLDVFAAHGQQIAVLDTSVNHAPEVFEYGWSPDVAGADHVASEEQENVYLLTGSTCLAGDVFGRYRFPAPVAVGDRVVFTELGAYTLVKAHRFNGVNLPTIYAWRDGRPVVVRRFTFDDFVSHWGGSRASVRGQLHSRRQPEPTAADAAAAGGPPAVRGVPVADPARREQVR